MSDAGHRHGPGYRGMYASQAQDGAVPVTMTPPTVSLRDWFAGLAMQAILSREGQQYGSTALADIAETAREAADALIEELHPAERHDTDPAPAPAESTSTETKSDHDIDRMVDAALASGMVTESIPAPASEPAAVSDESPANVAQPARGPLRRCEDPECTCHPPTSPKEEIA